MNLQAKGREKVKSEKQIAEDDLLAVYLVSSLIPFGDETEKK